MCTVSFYVEINLNENERIAEILGFSTRPLLNSLRILINAVHCWFPTLRTDFFYYWRFRGDYYVYILNLLSKVK